MGAPRKYTDEQREQALAVYQAESAAAASKQFTIPVSTITTWAEEAGIQSDGIVATRAATEAAQARAKQLNAEAAIKFAEKVHDLLRRCDEPMEDFKGQKAERVEYQRPPAADVRHFIEAATKAHVASRLELGQSTEQPGAVGDDMAAYLQGVHDQFERSQADSKVTP